MDPILPTPPQGRPGATNPQPPHPTPAAVPTPPAPAPAAPIAAAPAPTPAPNTTSAFVPAAHQSGAAHVDFDKLVLPKKPGTPSVDSAQRINAGLLFEQEQKAGIEGTGVAAAPSKVLGGSQTLTGDTAAPVPEPPKPKVEQPLVRPLQTYQSDIESLVDKKNISVVGIAAAEADKRAEKPLLPQFPASFGQGSRRGLWLSIAAVAMLAVAGGVGAYIYLRLQPVPIAEQSPAPFIVVDDTTTIEVTQNDGRSAVMQKLVAAQNEVALSLGLFARLQLVKKTAAGDAMQEISAPEFLQLIAPRVPPELVRTLEPQMLLGIHSFGSNEPFMILKADSYETAYSGMLAWEATMQADLAPLFNRTPPVRAKPQAPVSVPAPILPAAVSTSTASTTPKAASTTQASTTASSSAPAVPAPASAGQFFQGNFIDQIVENRDTRAILNQDGDLLLLWTMLDRSTIIITTNESTLREAVSRLSQASVVSLPQNQ